VEISEEEKEMIVQSLHMRINYMETRDIVLSAQDAINQDRPQILRLLGHEQCILRAEIAMKTLLSREEFKRSVPRYGNLWIT
jgi:hypothetical protein